MPQRKQRTRTSFRYADYQHWDDGQRWELIDGEAFAMAPAPVVDHQIIVGAMFAQLHQQLRGKPCKPMLSPLDVLLPRSQEADDDVTTTVQPDLLIVCDSSKIHHKFVRGAPDFVVEVVSPGNASHDHVRKRRRYEQAGVRELWLVDPVERVLWAYTLTDGAYALVAVQELVGTRALAILPEVGVDWDTVVAELPPLPAAPNPPTVAVPEPLT